MNANARIRARHARRRKLALIEELAPGLVDSALVVATCVVEQDLHPSAAKALRTLRESLEALGNGMTVHDAAGVGE